MTVAVVDALESRRYIEHHLGHYSRDGSRQSHMSRMRATDRLIKLIKDDHKVEAGAVHTYQGTECIILRDWIEDKKGVLRKTAIEYEDTRETQRMRKQLEKYNKLINASVIEIPGLDGEYVTGVNRISGYLVNYPENFVRRIFNNSKWSDGGRFYGGWWQRIPGELRRRIVINNSSNTCSEFDYSGLHIVLLYAQENIDYWKDVKVDPYTLVGYEASERMRQLLKFVLLVAINVANKESARRAIQNEINYDQETYGWLKTEDIKLLDIIDAFAECHHPIQNHLFSGSGVRLRNIDGKIAEHVINHFTDKDIVTLCIHDSFLIDALYENELNQVMNEAFSKVLKGYTNTDAIITSLMKHQSIYSDLLKE